MEKLALDAVHAGHLEVEDHHPEHEKVGKGCVDVHKLFVDRLSVHLQKDVPDRHNGWGIHLGFIPPQYQDDWANFVSRHQTVDLYEAFDDVNRKSIWLTSVKWTKYYSVMMYSDCWEILSCNWWEFLLSDWWKIMFPDWWKILSSDWWKILSSDWWKPLLFDWLIKATSVLSMVSQNCFHQSVQMHRVRNM